MFARLPESGQIKSRLADELSEAAALEIYRWQLRVQARTLTQLAPQGHAYTDYVYYAPRLTRFAARFKFASVLSAIRLRFRPQSEGDLGSRFRHACDTLLRRHDLVMLWGVDTPCLPGGIFEQAIALYPQSVVTLTRAGGCAFLSLAADKYSPGVFEGVRWSTPAAGADQLRALQQCGISAIVRGKVTQLSQAKDFTRLLRELEEGQRMTDLADLSQTIEKITER